METKNNNVVIIGLLVLIFGLVIGYFTGTYRAAYPMIGTQSEMHIAMDKMMVRLEGKTEAELEKAFLSDMIAHHRGAIEMAELLLKNTKRPELLKLGNNIIIAQTGEIETMKQWQENWFKE